MMLVFATQSEATIFKQVVAQSPWKVTLYRIKKYKAICQDLCRSIEIPEQVRDDGYLLILE